MQQSSISPEYVHVSLNTKLQKGGIVRTMRQIARGQRWDRVDRSPAKAWPPTFGSPQALAFRRRVASFVVPDRIVEEGKRRGEIRADAVSSQVATLIVSTLEGSLMVSRLQRKHDSRKDRGSAQLLHSARGPYNVYFGRRRQATFNPHKQGLFLHPLTLPN